MVPGAGPGLGRVKMRRYHRHPPQSYLLLLFTYSLEPAIHTTHLYHAPIFHTCSYSRYVTHLTPNLMKCDLDTRYVDPEIELARKGCLLATDLLLMDGLLPRSAWRRTCNLLCSNVTLCNFSLVRKIDTSGHKKQFERGCRTD